MSSYGRRARLGGSAVQQQQADASEGSAQQQAAAPTETLSGGSGLEDRARHHEMTDDSDDGEGVHALEMELLAEAGDEFEDEYEVEDDDDDGEEGAAEGEEGDDTDEEVEDEEWQPINNGQALMRLLMGMGRSSARDNTELESFQKLPVPIHPLRGPLAAALEKATSARDIGQSNRIWACLDGGVDASQLPLLQTVQQRLKYQADENPTKKRRTARHQAPQQQQQQQQQEEEDGADGDGAEPPRRSSLQVVRGLVRSWSSGMTTRSAAARRQAGGAAATAAATGAAPEDQMGQRGLQHEDDLAADLAAGSSSSSGSGSSEFMTGFTVVSTPQLLLKREVYMGRQAGLSRNQQQHLCCYRNLPLYPHQVRDELQSRAYIGQYSASGDFFIAAFQDRRVRLYDTNHCWKVRKDVTTRMTRWTITDTALSPDQRLLVYSSISPVAFVVNVGSNTWDLVDSQANITELHEPLAVDGSAAPGADHHRNVRNRRGWASDDDDDADRYTNYGYSDFGIWSIAWSPQGGQLVAGTNDRSVYVYDIESKHCLVRLTGHEDDVNAVAYLDGASPHLLVSGSDDFHVRLWDIRDKRGGMRQPTGVLVGHTEGVTHLCPKGDGIHVISNAKDQTIKLWDVRAALQPSAAHNAARQRPRIRRWDYRWESYPAAKYCVKHPADVSLMTYRGHHVLKTLIRAYFSPAHSTAQRFIYAGSADGVVTAWDVVSGKQVAGFQYHRMLVRDCSWHPYEPELATVSWDGTVVTWGVTPAPGKAMLAGDCHDMYDY